MRPQLQLALDVTSLDHALQLCQTTNPWVDWIEVGTPLVICEGLKSVTRIKKQFQNKPLLADIKIVDAASLIVTQALDAQADIITVLSAASDKTITTCIELAHKRTCTVLGDHISSQISIDACRRLADLGVDYVGMHITKDSDGSLPLASLEDLLAHLTVPVVLAGGINIQRLGLLKGLPIHAVVVGSAILNHSNPASAAQEFAAILNNWF